MNRIKIVIIGLLVGVILIFALIVYRYNLVFGDTIFQKSMMAGCMNKELRSENFSKSKKTCECYLGSLIERYSDAEIRNDIDEIILTDKSLFNKCRSDKESETSNAGNIPIDSTKFYQKIGWVNQIDKNTTEEVEAYISRENDTLINQFKVFRNGSIDSTMSKFYELKIEGYRDSLIQGEIRFFSPKDSTPNNRIESRDVSFYYLQRENDSLIIKEIITDTNYIRFPYRNFDNYSFVGFISDYRWITLDTTEAYLLNRNLFAIDSEVSTNNTFVELLK